MPATPREHPPFDLVLLDLDGTLVVTDRHWVPAARRGCARAFAELGIERPLPRASDWLRLAGLPLGDGLLLVLPDLDAEARERVQQRCAEEESRLEVAGGAALLPAALETLDRLRAGGAQLAVASHCGNGYLSHVMSRLPLGDRLAATRCLDSPGCTDKASMIADLLLEFGTRSAVFVGDRASDRDAAHANGIPHAHFAGGFGDAGDAPGCEATVTALDDLPALLAGRRHGLDAVAAALDLGPGGVPALAISGDALAGKGLVARDLARRVEATGRRAVVAGELDTPELAAWARDSLLEPHLFGEGVTPGNQHLEPDGLLVLEGRALLDPGSVPPDLPRLHVAASAPIQVRRAAGSIGRQLGPAALEAVLSERLPVERAEAAALLAERPTLPVLAGDDPLDPYLVGAPSPARRRRSS